jgi:hypothetical protein
LQYEIGSIQLSGKREAAQVNLSEHQVRRKRVLGGLTSEYLTAA